MHKCILQRIRCPACGSLLFLMGERDHETTIQKGILGCTRCEASYEIVEGIPVLLSQESIDQQTSEHESREANGRNYRNTDLDDLMLAVSRHHYVPTMKMAAKRFARRFGEDSWILDIGTGWGWYWHGSIAPQIVAMDFSLETLLVTKQMLKGQIDRNVHLVCADAVQLPFGTESVDGIWSVQMLQHLPIDRLISCLRRCEEIKRPNAMMELYWLNWNTPQWLVSTLLRKPSWRDRQEPYTLSMATGNTLRELLSEHLTGQIAIGYNETVFHPEIRMPHRLPLEWLDRGLGTVPLVNKFLARQVYARVMPDSTISGK